MEELKMKYKWEEECLKKYGEEVTQELINEQKKYEEMKKDNDCKHCGKGNEGAIVETKGGTPVIMRYGLWCKGRCQICGRHSNKV
ncbi:hypothetical protein D3C74_377160 [compost metagenome]